MSLWSEARLRAAIVAAGATLERTGLVRGREGNLSCRIPDGRVLLTPRGCRKGRLRAAELVTMWLGDPLPEAASSEALAHLEVYRAHAGIAAIVHAHPPMVLALARRRPQAPLPAPAALAEGRMLVGRIAWVPPLEPGSRELALACAAALGDAPVVVLAEHGVMAAGATLKEAVERVEVVEVLAGLEAGS